MRHLVLVFLLSSCSVLDTVKDAFSTTYEVGKVRGRHEVLDDILENKKKQDELNDLVMQEALLLIQKKEDENAGDRIVEFVIPIAATWAMLKKEASNLRKELRAAEATETRASLGKSDSE